MTFLKLKKHRGSIGPPIIYVNADRIVWMHEIEVYGEPSSYVHLYFSPEKDADPMVTETSMRDILTQLKQSP